jgi:hypothetical protein
MDENFQEALRRATLERNTSVTEKLFKKKFEDIEGSSVWG